MKQKLNLAAVMLTTTLIALMVSTTTALADPGPVEDYLQSPGRNADIVNFLNKPDRRNLDIMKGYCGTAHGGTPLYNLCIKAVVTAAKQKKCLKLPDDFTMDDFKAALQLGWELRIKKGEIPKCSEAYRPAMQPAMEAAGKCWNLKSCSKVVTDGIRKLMGCPKKKPKKNVTGRDIF